MAVPIIVFRQDSAFSHLIGIHDQDRVL